MTWDWDSETSRTPGLDKKDQSVISMDATRTRHGEPTAATAGHCSARARQKGHLIVLLDSLFFCGSPPCKASLATFG